MTQYFEGRRGRFWHGSPKGSDAAQWACPLPPWAGVGLAGRAALRAAAGRERRALAAPLAPFLEPFFAPVLAPFRAAALLALAALRAGVRVLGLMGNQVSHPARALKS